MGVFVKEKHVVIIDTKSTAARSTLPPLTSKATALIEIMDNALPSIEIIAALFSPCRTVNLPEYIHPTTLLKLVTKLNKNTPESEIEFSFK